MFVVWLFVFYLCDLGLGGLSTVCLRAGWLVLIRWCLGYGVIYDCPFVVCCFVCVAGLGCVVVILLRWVAICMQW